MHEDIELNQASRMIINRTYRRSNFSWHDSHTFQRKNQ